MINYSLFGDESVIQRFMTSVKIEKRMDPNGVFAIEYRVSKLQPTDFLAYGIEISMRDLNTLKLKVRQLIQEFCLGYYVEDFEENNKPYLEKYFEFIRLIYHAYSDDADNTPVSFRYIARKLAPKRAFDLFANLKDTVFLSDSKIEHVLRLISSLHTDTSIKISASLISKSLKGVTKVSKAGVVGSLSHPGFELFAREIIRRILGSIEIFRREQKVSSGNKIDIEISRSAEFRKIIEENQHIINIPKSIKTISIDFTNSRGYTDIISKFQKGYHSADTLLIIVLTGKGPIQSHVDRFTRSLARSTHPFKDNVIFLTADQFYFDFMGMDKTLDGFYYAKYKELQNQIYRCYASRFDNKEMERLYTLSSVLQDLLSGTGQIPMDRFLGQ